MACLLSVVTVTKNNRVGLASTLASVRGCLVGSDFELIVIDGASSDGTASVVDANRDIIARHVSEPDDGVYTAMNKGIDLATGRYILFLNAGDCLQGPESGQLLARHLSPTGDPTWYIFGACHAGEGVRPPRRIRNLPYSWYRHALGLQSQCHQSCVFSAELVAALGHYDLRYRLAADFQYIVRAGVVAAPIAVDKVLVTYEGGGMTEQAWRNIPPALHKVRVDLFGLRGIAKRLDAWWARAMLCRTAIFRSSIYKMAHGLAVTKRS